MNSWHRKTLSLLTSAALFLATLTPQPLHDVHAGGDTPHSHAANSGHGHHHHQGHVHGSDAGHDHHHQGQSPRNERTATAAVPHRHLSLLIFDITLPERDDSDSDSDTPLQLSLVARSGSTLVHSVALRDSLQDLDVAIGAKLIDLSSVSLHGRGAIPCARGLLCDGARRARTGVLLV